jgi:uncharacterized protein YbcI
MMTAQHMGRARRTRDVEQEIAFRMSTLARREFGLTPAETSATLSDGILRVKMEDALSQMARVVARSPEGPEALNTVYALLHDAGRPRMHQLIARIIGRPVWRSEFSMDAQSGDVQVTFELGAERV